MRRFLNSTAQLWLLGFVLMLAVILLFASCASASADNLTPAANTSKYQSLESATSSDIEKLTIGEVNTDIMSSTAPLVISVSVVHAGNSEPGLLPVQDYHIRISPVDSADKPLVDTSVKPINGLLVLPNLAGLSCEQNYQLIVETNGLNQSVTDRVTLVVRDQFVPETTDQRPVILAAPLVQGTITVPGGAYSPEIELRDAEGTSVISGKPLFTSGPQSLNDSSHIAVCKVTYSSSIKTNNQTAALFLRYRFTYPAQIISSWHNGAQFIPSDTANLETVLPGDGGETLSAHAQFEWQRVTGPGDYTIFLTSSDPATSNFASDSAKKILSHDNITYIDLNLALPNLRKGATFFWRVESAQGGLTSTWKRARFTTFLDDTIEIIPRGKSAEFTMGDAALGPDCQVLHTVRLTSAYGFSQTPITNSVLAELFNRRISRGLAGIEKNQLIDKADGTIILKLAELDYGQQFGIAVTKLGLLQALPGKEQHPATGMSWYGAIVACQEADLAMGLKPGSWRLPTEAEWEYAATGGGHSIDPWRGAIQGSNCNYLRSRDAFEDLIPPFTRKGGPTVPINYYQNIRMSQFNVQIGKIPADEQEFYSRLAHLDILGNVWEWCADWYDENYYSQSGAASTNPQGPREISPDRRHELETIGQLPARVVRGGAWNSLQEEINPRSRGKFPPGQTSFSIGFRMARNLNQ